MLNAPDPEPEKIPASPVSRGTIPLDLAEPESLEQVRRRMKRFDLARYRPFHMVAVSPGGSGPELLEMRWNGEKTLWADHVPPKLFVSSSLQPIQADRSREESWTRFIRGNAEPDKNDLAAFMENHQPEKGSLSTCMHREEGGTVSRTIVYVGADRIVMEYTDGPPCDSASPVSVYEMDPTRYSR
jgi:hypothetical protein